MSRSFEFSSPFGGFSTPIVTTRTFRDHDGGVTTTRVEETVRSRPVYEPVSTFTRAETIRQPPSTSMRSVSRGSGPGVVTSSSEYERGPDGRPSHYASTVYKSPYGKTYRFNSHY